MDMNTIEGIFKFPRREKILRDYRESQITEMQLKQIQHVRINGLLQELLASLNRHIRVEKWQIKNIVRRNVT